MSKTDNQTLTQPRRNQETGAIAMTFSQLDLPGDRIESPLHAEFKFGRKNLSNDLLSNADNFVKTEEVLKVNPKLTPLTAYQKEVTNPSDISSSYTSKVDEYPVVAFAKDKKKADQSHANATERGGGMKKMPDSPNDNQDAEKKEDATPNFSGKRKIIQVQTFHPKQDNADESIDLSPINIPTQKQPKSQFLDDSAIGIKTDEITKKVVIEMTRGTEYDETKPMKDAKATLYTRRQTLRDGRLFAHPADLAYQPKKSRLRVILEEKSKTHEEFKGLQKFFSRTNFLDIIKQKLREEKPLDNQQLTLINDMSNPYFSGIHKERIIRTDEKSRFRYLFWCCYRAKTSCKRAKLKMLVRSSTRNKRKRDFFLFRWCFFMKEWIIGLFPRKMPPFEPDGMFRLFWDLTTIAFIFYEMIFVPFQLSFDFESPSVIIILNYIIDSFFMIDILMTFNTGYYSKGSVVKDRKKIFLHYLRGWFCLDFLASFPINWMVSGPNEELNLFSSSDFTLTNAMRSVRVIRILRLLRIFKLKRILSKLDSYYMDISRSLNGILGFLKLAVTILFCAHLIACFWHLIAALNYDADPDTWITKYGIYSNDLAERYVSSIYWATTTMLAVGYGDIVPVTILEKALCILAMFMSCAVFGYAMNMVNALFQEMDQTKILYRQTMTSLNHYMRHKNVSNDIKIKVRRYLEYTLDYNNKVRMNESSVMDLLSEQLRNDIVIDINGKILKACKLWKSHFSKTLLVQTTFLMQEQIFSPGEIIIREDTIDDCAIFFISQGAVELYNYYSFSLYETLGHDKYFGEISFFTGNRRTASARTADFSAVFYVKRDDFLGVVENYPRDRETFHQIKDRITNYRDYQDLEIACFSCGEKNHVASQCPELHYCVDKSAFIRRELNERRNFVKKFKRDRRRNAANLKGSYAILAKAAQEIQDKLLHDESEGDSAPFLKKQTNPEKSTKHIPTLLDQHLNHPPLPNQQGLRDIPKTMLQIDDAKEQINIMKKSAQNLLSGRQIKSGLGSGFEIRYGDENGFELDHVWNYSHYFPHNNIISIIRKSQKLDPTSSPQKPKDNSMVLPGSKKKITNSGPIKKNKSFFEKIKGWVKTPTIKKEDEKDQTDGDESIFLDKSHEKTNQSDDRVFLRNNQYMPQMQGPKQVFFPTIARVQTDFQIPFMGASYTRQQSNQSNYDPRNLRGASNFLGGKLQPGDDSIPIRAGGRKRSNTYLELGVGTMGSGSVLFNERKRSTFLEKVESDNAHLKLRTNSKLNNISESNLSDDEGNTYRVALDTLAEDRNNLKRMQKTSKDEFPLEKNFSAIKGENSNFLTYKESQDVLYRVRQASEVQGDLDITIEMLLKKMGPEQLISYVKRRSSSNIQSSQSRRASNM